MTAPRVSVVVRSYNRLGPLAELCGELLAQRHDSFEVVIVEQSTVDDPPARAAIDWLARDPRVRLLRFPPLGGPRARNEGVRAARGAIVLLIDDDDLPGDADWIARHERNFADPLCLAVNGRALVAGARPYRDPARAERDVMSLSWLGWQRPYARVAVRKKIESVAGGNVSIRRAALERAGLWDECTPVEDELSFAYRLRAALRPGEYLVFDPEATMRRRIDLPGGMDKRFAGTLTVARRHFRFLHRIVGHYFPRRYWLLQPAYLALLYRVTVEWVWDDSRAHDTAGKKLWAAAWLLVALPPLWLAWLALEAVRRVREGPLPHAPTLTA